MGETARKIQAKPAKQVKTEITNDELVELINKYTNYHYRVWKSYHRLHADWDDLYLEVAEAACEGRKNYMASEVKTASITTFIVRCIRNRINKYRRRQYVRQVKFPLERLGMSIRRHLADLDCQNHGNRRVSDEFDL